MKELIKITEIETGEKVVSARDLHAFLESGKDFSNWIKDRIEKYQFIKNQDYILLANLGEQKKRGGHNIIEYGLTIDTAKEIAMVEGNEKGRTIRRYFIEVEKQVRQSPAVPQSFAQALKLAAEQQEKLELQEKEIKKLTIKAGYADLTMTSEHLWNISSAAKILQLPYGSHTFFKLLRMAGVFYHGRNEPLQEYVTNGYFQLKQKTITRKTSPTKLVMVALLTPKGLSRMNEWLEKRGFRDIDKVYEYIARKEKEAKDKLK